MEGYVYFMQYSVKIAKFEMYLRLWKFYHFIQNTVMRCKADHNSDLQMKNWRGDVDLPTVTWKTKVELKAVIILTAPPLDCFYSIGL